MLDIRRIRENPEEIARLVSRRGKEFRFDNLLQMDAERRSAIAETESLKAKKNAVSKQIPVLKKKGEDTSALFAEMKQESDRIKALDDRVAELDEAIRTEMLAIPNVPHASVPDGLSDADNVEVRRFLEPTKFDFGPKAHWDLGTDLDI